MISPSVATWSHQPVDHPTEESCERSRARVDRLVGFVRAIEPAREQAHLQSDRDVGRREVDRDRGQKGDRNRHRGHSSHEHQRFAQGVRARNVNTVLWDRRIELHGASRSLTPVPNASTSRPATLSEFRALAIRQVSRRTLTMA